MSKETLSSDQFAEGFAFFVWHQLWEGESCKGYGSSRETTGLLSWCTLAWNAINHPLRSIYEIR